MRGIAVAGLVVLLNILFVFGAAAEERPVVTSLDVADNALSIKVSGPFTYTIYKPSDPYLVVVEMPGVGAGSVEKRLTSDKKGISEVRLTETGPPTQALKIEVLLETPADVEPLIKGNSLVLAVKEIEGGAGPPRTTSIEEPAQAGEAGMKAPAVRDMSFEYDKAKGLLKLVFKADGRLEPAIFSLDGKIVIDFPEVAMKAALPTAVVSPVKNIRYGVHKDKVRVVVDLKRKADFDAFSEADSLVIAFPVEAAPAELEAPVVAEVAGREEAKEAAAPVVEAIPPSGEEKYSGKLISLDFQDADIKPIFRLLGDVAGLNVVLHPAVGGAITLKLINVPWDQALDIILETFTFDKSIDGNILHIAPQGFFARRKEDAARLKVAEAKVEPLAEAVISLSFVDATIIKPQIDKLLSPGRGAVEVHPSENSLILSDTADVIRLIKERIKKLDIPTRQVMIEAKIVEVSTSHDLQLGIRWSGTIQDEPGSLGTTTTNVGINAPIGGASGVGAAATFGILSRFSRTRVDLSLQALETLGKSKNLSNPRVLTLNKKNATIQQGLSIPVQTTTAEGSTTQFINANLSLNVTPTIKGDFVELVTTVANSEPQVFGGATAINQKTVSTQAVIRNGETLVIGGIYKSAREESIEAVPFLSKIPLIGWLFKTKKIPEDSTSELLIFITPTIVESDIGKI